MSDREGFEDARHDEQDKIFWRIASKEPIPMHLHSSLRKAVSKALAKKIEDHGGNPKADEDDAEVIICRQEGPAFAALTRKYDHERYKWVEAPSWVDYCIKEKRYDHPIRPPLLKPQTGGRTQYTPADDNHIVEFLAKRIPYRDMKGRSGQKVWKDLCERTDLYPWAVTHSWQSWRERYVKNTKIFDDRIEKYVSSDPDPPVRGGKGQYRVDHGKRGPRNKPRFEDIPCVVEEENEEIDIEEGLQRKRVAKKPASGASPSKRRRVAPSGSEINAPEEEEEEDNNTIAQHAEDSRPGPSNDVPGPTVQTNASDASSLPLFLPEERENTSAPVEDEPRGASPTVSEAQQALPSTSHPPAPAKAKSVRKPSSKGSENVLADANASVAPSAAANLDQRGLIDDDNAPPASRTRSRSRQPSVGPSTQQSAQSTRTRRTRATASPLPPPPPVPPPPPTLTFAPQEPQTIDLTQYQIRRRDPTRPVLRPALIPIPELSEGSQPRLRSVNRKRTTTSSVHDELPAWETLQPGVDGDDGKSESENDDSFGYVGQHDDDDISDSGLSGMSDMILLNEGIKALTEQTIKRYPQEDIVMASATRVARKIPHTSPPQLHDQSSDEEYEENENEGGEFEFENTRDDDDEEEESGNNGKDSPMTGVESLNTQTSVPAVGTYARKYLVSRTPFTPARGTLAGEHVSSERTTRLLRERKVDKGKGRAW